jgi:hypothetical protein
MPDHSTDLSAAAPLDAATARLTQALEVAESERSALSDASRAAAVHLEQTIGRLRGLLAT